MNEIEAIKLSEYGASLGTRDLGAQLREKSLALIKAGGRIMFDFTNVHVISSGFADELFGKLYIAIGKDIFFSNIKINNFDNVAEKEFIINLIKKSIQFRERQTS